MTTDESGNSSLWSREQEKLFENALATHTEDSSDRWEKIAADVPGKSIAEIKHHYELLVEDIDGIESGRVPLPAYVSSSEGSGDHGSEGGAGKKGTHFGQYQGDSNHGGKASRSDQERRKGIAWTEDEHRLTHTSLCFSFLLYKYAMRKCCNCLWIWIGYCWITLLSSGYAHF